MAFNIPWRNKSWDLKAAKDSIQLSVDRGVSQQHVVVRFAEHTIWQW